MKKRPIENIEEFREELKRILTYCAETGDFHWKVGGGGRKIGKVAGSVQVYPRGNKYRRIGIKNRLYLAHRLAWIYVYGSDPEDELDHADGDGLNNRIDNLSQSDDWKNAKNYRKRCDNRTGVCGVVMRGDRFIAQIGVNKTTKHIGIFGTLEEAVAARKAAEREHEFHENHGKERST